MAVVVAFAAGIVFNAWWSRLRQRRMDKQAKHTVTSMELFDYDAELIRSITDDHGNLIEP